MRLITEKFLLSRQSSDFDEPRVQVYESLMRSHARFKFSYFLTFTFSKAVTDYAAVHETNRLLKRFIKRRLYSRRDEKADLNFIFFIECHDLKHKEQNKFHIHVLMTEAAQSLLKLEQMKSDEFKLRRLKSAIQRTACRVYCFDCRSCAKICKTAVKRVYDKENLSDYLLKQLRKTSIADVISMIDVLNSDLSFSDYDCETNFIPKITPQV